MVLSEKEKNGAFKILSLLSDTEVVSLAKTVTKGQIIIGTREGKMEGGWCYFPSVGTEIKCNNSLFSVRTDGNLYITSHHMTLRRQMQASTASVSEK